ncbi:Hok/Gef family protein [Rouxiella chamberiensis]|uniref:Hok/Gef family protein n=2 Tax=Rouxiella chamberiensis TaxID=1513468 RepID=A0ABY7HUG3_9GAMM|nr:Hok/Gef family protein [Rouxiella chamberiensis]WAT03066.1 Hok/Gef family protein [Rouxiella chamberiensis]
MLLKLTVITVIAFFVTVLLFTWMTRETLCELHITSPTMEVVALLTCTLKL